MNFKVALALFLLPLVTEGGARRCRLARAQEEIPAHAASAGGQVHADLPQAGHVETYNDIPAFKTLADMNRPTVTFRTDFSRFRMPAATKRSKTRSKPTKPKKASGKKLKIIAAMGLVVTTLAAISTVGLGLYFTNKSEADCPEKSQETQEKTPSSSADSSSVPSLKSTKPGLKDRGQPAPRKARPKHKPATVTDRSGEAGAAHSDDEAELEEPKPQGSPLQTREQTPSPFQKRHRLASPRGSNSGNGRQNEPQHPTGDQQEEDPQHGDPGKEHPGRGDPGRGHPGKEGFPTELSQEEEYLSDFDGGTHSQLSRPREAGSSRKNFQESHDEWKDAKAYPQPCQPEDASSSAKFAAVTKSPPRAFSPAVTSESDAEHDEYQPASSRMGSSFPPDPFAKDLHTTRNHSKMFSPSGQFQESAGGSRSNQQAESRGSPVTKSAWESDSDNRSTGASMYQSASAKTSHTTRNHSMMPSPLGKSQKSAGGSRSNQPAESRGSPVAKMLPSLSSNSPGKSSPKVLRVEAGLRQFSEATESRPEIRSNGSPKPLKVMRTPSGGNGPVIHPDVASQQRWLNYINEIHGKDFFHPGSACKSGEWKFHNNCLYADNFSDLLGNEDAGREVFDKMVDFGDRYYDSINVRKIVHESFPLRDEHKLEKFVDNEIRKLITPDDKDIFCTEITPYAYIPNKHDDLNAKNVLHVYIAIKKKTDPTYNLVLLLPVKQITPESFDLGEKFNEIITKFYGDV
eukprot:GHVT01079842.1.p1 GENE.GHVT01079842.1~~GHVT01079842.1.p1  ORF type:complete len:742 (+),score=73.26 GHVT01079842.1:218-2443(+)